MSIIEYKFSIHEMLFENQIIGYRLRNRTTWGTFDFSKDLLPYIYENYIKYCNILVGLPCYCEYSDGSYYTKDDDFLSPTELDEKSDADKHLSMYKGTVDTKQSLNNRMVYRYFICRDKLLRINIPMGLVASVNVSTKMSSSWGYCYHKAGDSRFHIDIAERLLISAEDSGVDEVIMHELVHTCKGCLNHGHLWKEWGDVVYHYYKVDLTRVSSSEKLNVDAVKLIQSGYFACQCMSCGTVISKKTECKFIKRPEYYNCGKCGGSFIRIS